MYSVVTSPLTTSLITTPESQDRVQNRKDESERDRPFFGELKNKILFLRWQEREQSTSESNTRILKKNKIESNN